MSDIQIKEKIDKMYEKSLFFNHEDSCKSIRLIQATKSLIGININEPLLNLLDYTEGLVDSVDKEKPQILNEKFDLPEVVSYKNLEESLLNKNKMKALGSLDSLCKVSDGMQIVEFLLQFSLKYCDKTYLFVWSIYKMMLFLNNKYIQSSLNLIVNVMLNNKINIEQKNDKTPIVIEDYEYNNYDFEEFCILYSISKEKLIRKKYIYDKCSKKMLKFIRRNLKVDNLNYKESQIKNGRRWIHDYLQKIEPKKISNELILILDAARSILKTAEENNVDVKWAWHNINNKLNES
tara:strand:+ start:427 stop:1302 length:876 start_codon:yes stop_codon:yes gene_type:complete